VQVLATSSKTKRALLWTWRVGLAVALLAGATSVASAQNLFEALFGGFERPTAHSYANPNTDGRHDGVRRVAASPHSPAGNGQYSSYCVRTCDGRYFPMQRHSGAAPAQMCSAMCSAAKTKIFSGSEIARAVGPDGSRYEDLDNAFAYRERVVENCTCNGKDAFGLVTLDVNSDPTLRPGDVVATSGGLMAYSVRSRRGDTAANFTPINSADVARDVREKLANTAIATR
jgi:hypothetical protein